MDDLTLHFSFLEAKMSFPVCICVFTQVTPMSTNVLSNVVCHGPEGKQGSSHICQVHNFPFMYLSLSVQTPHWVKTFHNISNTPALSNLGTETEKEEKNG